MAVERTLLENVDTRAHRAFLRLTEVNRALDCAVRIIDILTITENRSIGIDETTLHAARVLRRLLRAEVADHEKFARSAASIADAAHGIE